MQSAWAGAQNRAGDGSVQGRSVLLGAEQRLKKQNVRQRFLVSTSPTCCFEIRYYFPGPKKSKKLAWTLYPLLG